MTNDRSRESLLAFLDYCKEKGLLKPQTAEARKAAVNQVLGILSDDEASDISDLDLDDVISRFHNLHGKRYTPDSLKTYKARVKGAIFDFMGYLKNPLEFRPRITTVKRASLNKSSSSSLGASPVAAYEEIRKSPTSHSVGTSTLPIPIRSDITVLVHGLPFDLTEGEARKIGNVIAAMATPA